MDLHEMDHLGLVDRTFEEVERDGRPAKVVTAARSFPTTADDLWDAVTTPERIGRWFLPVTGDLRVGGRYQLEGNAGGEVLSCEPPRRLEITWEFQGDVSWVSVELTPAGDGASCRLELRHVAHPPEEFWDQYGPGAVGVGWDGALLGLGLYVGSDEPFDREATQAWAMSPAAAGFYLASSAAWAEAAKAAGVADEVANGWHERASAFYTGQET
jgi:uncharacterized protein YndB with AHSA1/START domain